MLSAEAEMVVADGDVIKSDDRLGEQSERPPSIVQSTILTLLTTSVEMKCLRAYLVRSITVQSPSQDD